LLGTFQFKVTHVARTSIVFMADISGSIHSKNKLAVTAKALLDKKRFVTLVYIFLAIIADVSST